MDQIKIGRFIAECRKMTNLTQNRLVIYVDAIGHRYDCFTIRPIKKQ